MGSPTTTTPPKTTSYPRKLLRSTTSKSRTRSTSRSTIFQLQPSPRSLQLLEEKERESESTTIDLDLLYSGQYHEVNPGQYHEVHPGQYHEVNPGQYKEEVYSKPVSSQYPNQGQYRNHEDSYSEEYEVNNVKVDFDHQDNHKTYTALDGEVSQRRISQILERFF